MNLCKDEKGLIPNRLFVAGLEAADQGAAAMRRSMANENELEIVPRLHFLLASILAIAKIATMVGLFFTVISMINTFNAIGEQSAGGKAKEIGGHASKIGLALFATALGLFTAIPLVFMPRAVQGLDREVRDQGEVGVAEAHHSRHQLQKGPVVARREAGGGRGGRRRRPQVAWQEEGGTRVAAVVRSSFDPELLNGREAAEGVRRVVRRREHGVQGGAVQRRRRVDAGQGRLAAADMVRPAGTQAAWAKVGTHELLTDYIPRPAATVAAVAAEGEVLAPAAVLGGTPVELPDPELPPSVSRFEDDDEVDMIPLIDISMVLLVFFIIIQAAGALAPVDVPEMKYGGQLSNDPGAITITIEKLNTEDVYYSVRVGGAAPKPSHDKLPNSGRGDQGARRGAGRGDPHAGGADRVPQRLAARARLRTAPRAGTAPQAGHHQLHRRDGRRGTEQMSARGRSAKKARPRCTACRPRPT